MPAELHQLIRHIRRVASRQELNPCSDRELLARFTEKQDEEAFTEFVKRHAALVAGVARRVLHGEHDIEDVFQATFLVVARRARWVRWSESAANWLHSVAYHLALRVRKDSSRQQMVARNCHKKFGSSSLCSADPIWELKDLLDQELSRLPEPNRNALILCYLEGRTRDEAARQTGWSIRTLDRRLDEGRRLLRDRLARRSQDTSVVLLAAGLDELSSASFVQMTWATVQFVTQANSMHASVASSALKLANSAVTGAGSMLVKVVGAITLTVALAGASTGLFGLHSFSPRFQKAGATVRKTAAQEEQKAEVQRPRLDRFGDQLPQGAVARLGGTRFRVSHPEWISYADGGRLLFAGGQQGITLFDAATGRRIRSFGDELNTTCWTTAVSRDGKLAVIGGLSRTPNAVVYDTLTGKRLCEIESPNGSSCRFVAFSPDGDLLASTTHACRVDLYHSRTGNFLRTFEWEFDGQSRVYYGDVLFMPDGKALLASTQSTGVVRIFDIASGQELRRFAATPLGIAGMALSPDGALLAILESQQGRDFFVPGNKVRILDARSGRQVAEFLGKKLSRRGLSFSHDAKTLFAGEDDDGIGIWETATGKRTGSVPNLYKGDWLKSLAIAPDGKAIALDDMTSIHTCDITSGKDVGLQPGHAGSISSVALHPFDSTAATGGRDGRLILWDRTTGAMIRELVAGRGQVHSVIYSPDGRYLYAVAELIIEPRHSSIRCWDSVSGKEIWRLDDHPVQPGKLAIAPDGKTLGGLGGSDALLIDAATGRPLGKLDGAGEAAFFHNGWWSMAELAFSLDGGQLLAWGNDKGIHTWELATGRHRVQECERLNKIAFAVAFSPDRKQLIVGGAADHLFMVDVASGKTNQQLKAVSNDVENYVFGATFSPDGRTLAWGGPMDGIVRLVDLGAGAIRQQVTAHDGRCLPGLFSKDGSKLVTVALDGTALIWDLTRVPAIHSPLSPAK